MSQTQVINQLFLVLSGLLLTSLFISTFAVSTRVAIDSTRRYWLLSVGSRAAALFAMALIPVWGAPCAVIANTLFIFSAGCLALLFRSWRTPVDQQEFQQVVLFSLFIGISVEILRQANPSFALRMVVLGAASVMVTGWELSELYQKIRYKPSPLLKLIAAVVLVQVCLSIASMISSVMYADPSISYVTDNGTRSIYVIWFTIGIHLVIYFFIGSYLFQRMLDEKISAVQKKNEIADLLGERERLLSSLIMSNRIASTGALSASVTHEISQPMTAALLQLSLLKRAAEQKLGDDREFMALLSDMFGNISRSKEVLEKLRSLFQQGPAELTRCDINELVSQTITLMGGRLKEAGVMLEHLPGSSITACIVEKEVQQVIINLINNAIDALERCSDGDKLIRVELSALADAVRIVVTDNGPGIRPELNDSLFELTRSTKPDGMGIGLWISRYIIESHHGGRLYVDNDRSVAGAQFVMELPKQSTC